MGDKRTWCLVCGEARGNCCHSEGYTENMDKAYRIWLDYKKKELRGINNVKSCENL